MNEYTYDRIEVGMKEGFSVRITEEEMTKFLEITKDVNPLHNDEDYARSKGHKKRVVFGMLTAAYLSTLAGVYLPGKYSLIHSVKTKFSGAVYVGDELRIEGTVVEKNDTFKIIIVKVVMVNQNQEKVCKAEMQIGVI
ncbi:MAG: MaoC family dehydratase N-terminal domain-containing protein [Lachnospiraceae bacterium]|nr:MaoC family dehydratase N-terminal domain-containing protein [Lachnospiraceae bacterium]